MKIILVPTDFSACANQALHYATNYATSLKQEVRIALLHVLSPPIPATEIPIENAWEMLGDQKKESSALLRKCVQEQVQAGPLVEFTTHVRIGLLLSEVEKFIEESPVCLIIMGTLGASGPFSQLFGSNAYSLVKDLSRDVLIVPPDKDFEPYRTIVFAADLDDENAVELRKAVELASRSEARVIVAHVEPEEADIRTREMDKRWSRLRGAVSHPKLEFTTVHSDTVESGLADLAVSEKADLLIMSPRCSSFWDLLFHSSHTREIILQPRIPTLCLKHTRAESKSTANVPASQHTSPDQEVGSQP